MIHPGEDLLLVSEEDRYPRFSSRQLLAHPLFFPAVKRTEWFIENQEVIFLPEKTGKVQALEFSPAEPHRRQIAFPVKPCGCQHLLRIHSP